MKGERIDEEEEMSMMPKIEDVELDLENTPPGYQRQQKPPEISLLTGGFIDEVDSKYSSFSFLDLLSYPIQGLSYISNTTTIPPLPGSLNSSSLPSLVPPPPPPDVTSLLLLDSTAKPNSLSMSSSSCEITDQARSAVTERADEGEKEKSKNQKKRQRQQRFAFVTRTEVNHLEDGYRWRKYGQKAVKDSPFPRNYYRCTSTTCGVKKRVERSSEDPTVVVTTYEGQHTHKSLVMPRGGHLTVGGLLSPESTLTPSPLRLPYASILRSPATRFGLDSGSYGGNLGYGRSNPGLVEGIDVVRDHGLLQDLVPSEIRKKHIS